MKREDIDSIIESKECIRALITFMASTENSKRFEDYHNRVVEEVEKLYQFIDQCRFMKGGET